MPLWVPLMAFLYVLIWLEDRKNPMFMQPRIGRTGGTFRTAKFRTMVPDAEKVLQQALAKNPALKAEWETHFKLRKDPRITRVGRFLRKTSLDEIPQLLNVPEASMLGAEFDIQWVPAEGWLVTAGVGLLDGEIDDPGFIANVFKGNNLPNVPDVTFTGAVRKEFQVANGTASLQPNWRYQDDVTYDLANARNLSQEGYWILNARAAYNFGSNEEYEVSVWGKNLNGQEYCNSATSLEGLVESLICVPGLSEPTYGITASYHFN